MPLTDDDREFLKVAYDQALLSYQTDGIPIGAALVQHTPDGPKLLGVGHNKREQKGSPILHGETDCLQNIGRLKAEVYRECTMYTTLSPCLMCTGSVLLYRIPRIVIGENKHYMGGEALLKEHGVEVIVADDPECTELFEKFEKEKPELWNEDIGEPDGSTVREIKKA
ncbi:cytidine deaminase-like protein [Saitoella complicata NRRL Y-17804]|uniref:cytidine deaminase-like protein n=1 Tax=Saitoella complicata (strain BCRC 22490 / CBS 7301 / JCM 7358 / NBRC 10748 / NRRL Y-17804) TaxID=698492 RepID=UPI0008671942|nr:cytidine deaminase-like protein [Saitoella complicata NRRL Y-17804]ODQ55727.1 cytidine deaminase-like protein [Saitoella complicata NRRL Y-17804]